MAQVKLFEFRGHPIVFTRTILSQGYNPDSIKLKGRWLNEGDL